MDSRNITIEQAEAMGRVIGHQLEYLGRLRKRLDAVGFSPVDPLYLAVHRAFDGVHGLRVKLHYLSCEPGTTGTAAPTGGAPPSST